MHFTGMNDTTYARVRDRIREDILTGVFAPGVRLVVAELVQRYGVSQMPIREALQQLQGEGLVSLLPQKGASVRKLDEHFISNMYDVRMAIETMLVRRSIEYMTESQICVLEQIQNDYEIAVESDKMSEALHLNEKFHSIINVTAHNPEAVKIIDQHWGLIDSLRSKFGFSNKRVKEIISDHRQIIEALKQRDVQLAATVTEKHVKEAKDDLILRMRTLTE
ncbi:GntR family transcriptional regulator [Paenibacillus sedimenti]|uniref:GntR family transcriptional regulator n=1 Tax=Paenibacillus sedimenti TaxID=2770274 RepID=A0A926KPC9_9BACL|nr:GntR family transcriptional regulator [Paenibacillus sedimenti]MBD0379799.1 GntR family transcriptional regulator [Paenibacillus sedimenti]